MIGAVLAALLAAEAPDAGLDGVSEPQPSVDAAQGIPEPSVVPALAPTLTVGIFSVSPTLSLEADARIHSNEVERESGFAIRRLRTGVRVRAGTWGEAVGRIEYLADADQHVGLFDAFVEIAPLDDLRISAGYRVTPLFASARDEPIEALPIPELALPVRTFWPGRDLGVEVHRLPTSRLPLEGFLRVGNGSGSAAGNDDSQFAFEGRVDLALGRAQPGAQLDPWGFRAGFGGHYESSSVDRIGLGGTTAVGFLFWRPPNVFGPRMIGEAHLVAWLRGWTLRAEGATAYEGRSRDTDGNPSTPREPLQAIVSWGAVAEVAYMLIGAPRTPGAWPNANPDPLDWRTGSLELAARAEWVALGLRAPLDVKSSGAKGGALSVRWWVTRWLAVSAAVYLLEFDRAPLEEPFQRTSWTFLARLSAVIP